MTRVQNFATTTNKTQSNKSIKIYYSIKNFVKKYYCQRNHYNVVKNCDGVSIKKGILEYFLFF